MLTKLIYIINYRTLNPIGPHAVPMCQATTLTKACTLPMQFPCPSQNYCIGPFSIFSMMKIVKHFPCLLVQTISLSWVPIFPIYMKAHFLGAPYHNLLSLSLSHTHLTQLEDGSKESGQHHHPIWRAKSEGKKVQQRTSPASQEGMYQAPDFLMLDPQVNEDYSWKCLIFQKHSSRS